MNRGKEERLKEDLDEVIRLIRDKVGDKNLIAIILYGSYGRDEGAFYCLEDSRWEPYNDYDIVVVIKDLIKSDLLISIERDLKESLSIRWIDISQKTIADLESLKLSVFNFDLKNGSKVIYGDPEILNKIPDFKAEHLPLIEAEVLFFTRLWCFCGCLRADWSPETINTEEMRFFRNQMAKAILAVGDVLLLSKGMYESSYVARVTKLSEIYADDPDLVELLTWALDEKLTPKSDEIGDGGAEVFYRKTGEVFYRRMLEVLSQKYGKKLESVAQYYQTVRMTRENFVLVLKTLLKKRRFQATAFKPVDWAQAYILEVYLFGEQKSSLQDVRSILSKYLSKDQVPQTWDEQRIKVAELKIGGAW